MHGVNISIDPDKVLGLINQTDGRMAEMNIELKTFENKAMDIHKAKNFVARVNNERPITHERGAEKL